MAPRGAAPLLLALALSLAAGTAEPAGPSVELLDRETGCRLLLPPDWQGLTVHWSGTCPDGFADGLGVVRAYRGARLHAAFFGELERGDWRFGVLDDADGYRAGRFRNGAPDRDDGAQDGDRNGLIAAFATASRAARQLGDAFARRGNAATAAHYRRKAEELAGQLD